MQCERCGYMGRLWNGNDEKREANRGDISERLWPAIGLPIVLCSACVREFQAEIDAEPLADAVDRAGYVAEAALSRQYLTGVEVAVLLKERGDARRAFGVWFREKVAKWPINS